MTVPCVERCKSDYDYGRRLDWDDINLSGIQTAARIILVVDTQLTRRRQENGRTSASVHDIIPSGTNFTTVTVSRRSPNNNASSMEITLCNKLRKHTSQYGGSSSIRWLPYLQEAQNRGQHARCDN